MIRVVIADDQELVRGGIRMILESEADITVVGEAGDGAGAVRLTAEQSPDVLLLDVQMPGQDGLAAAGEIVASGSATRVLMLTTFDLDAYVYQALRAGASGFLLKDMPGEDIVIAIRQAARGTDALLAPAVTRRLIERFATSAPQQPPPAVDELTTREVDVLRLIGRGMSNAEIATELVIAETTVKTHVARVLMKLGLRDRVQAAIYAHEHGLV
ncbi:MAG TPA: response regulator transcription factor [Jatrophihabitans sp.]|nr:response regulator transcription factor [Jatrophihabitans sp.]